MIMPSKMPPRPKKIWVKCKCCGAPKVEGERCEYCGITKPEEEKDGKIQDSTIIQAGGDVNILYSDDKPLVILKRKS